MDSGRILLVDDDQLICISLRSGLERQGYDVTIAASGREAITELERQRFDIVVADLVMDSIGGLAVLKRSKELYPGAAVIILTAYADLASAVQALRLGADDYLSKPCDATELSDRILAWKQKRRPLGTDSPSELLLRETHHRVKNDFLMLSALVGLQVASVDGGEDRLLFEELRTRIETVSLVHEELYHGANYREINVLRFLTELCRRTAHGFNPHNVSVKLEVDAPDLEIATDLAIPIGLIVNELVTNSMRHAFEPNGPGKILVRFEREGADYAVEVCDDGRGLPEGLESAETLGMKIVVALTSQLRGSLRYRSEQGAIVTVSVPAADRPPRPGDPVV